MRIYGAIPVISSNHVVHDVRIEDSISVEMLKRFHGSVLESASPPLVAADSKCCYRAASLALYGNQSHHLFVRVLTALELRENQSTYDGDSLTRLSELFSTAIPYSPFKNLIDDASKPGAYAELANINAMSAAFDSSAWYLFLVNLLWMQFCEVLRLIACL